MLYLNVFTIFITSLHQSGIKIDLNCYALYMLGKENKRILVPKGNSKNCTKVIKKGLQ